MLRKAILLAGAGLASSILSSPGAAQDAGAVQDTAAARPVGEDIVVTARKIEESVQDVPLAITAFSADDLRKRSITDLEDVAMQTPGLVFEDYSNGGFGTPVIRGATQFSIAGLEQNVSVFLDGIYIPRQYAFDVGAMNLERIEVVKGPQSALYGANAFAGAINYITSSRSLTQTSAYAEAGVSQNGGFDLSGKLNLVAIPDMLSLRVAGGYSRFSGDWRNNHPDANADINPGTRGKLGGYEKWSAQVGATFRPFEKLTIDLDYYHFDTNSENRASYRITRANGDTNCSDARVFGAPVKQLFCGEIPATPIPGPSGVAGLVVDPRSFGLDAQTDLFRGAANFDITDTLSLTYQFGHIEGDVFSAGNSDRDPLVGTRSGPTVVNVFSLLPVGGFSYDSHEARVQYAADSGLYLLFGGFIQNGRDLDRAAFAFAPFRGLDPISEIPAGATVSDTTTRTDTKAVFGRIQVPFFEERLKLSAEARYTDEDKTLVAPAGTFKFGDSYITPRFGIDFQLSPDNLIYSSVAKGIKSGGVNTSTFAGLLAEERFYGPDSNWTYEIGSKNSFGGGRGYINVALFLIDWSNLQLSATPTGAPANTASIITNLGGAKSKGIELEGLYEVVDGLTVNAGLAYIDATYNKGTVSARVTRANLCDNIVCAANGDIGGNDLQRTSKWQWNIGASYDTPITEALDFFGRLDVAGQSKQFASEINAAVIEPRTLVNARLGVRTDRWSLALWAKNLFDKKYVANAFFVANPFQVDYLPTLGNRRRIGATLSFTY